ncbi:MAG: polysaccharide biosynthesis protein [Planctomycetota bacterium]
MAQPAETAILIGTADGVREVRSQMLLRELDGQPMPWPCGCVLTETDTPAARDPGLPVLGELADLPELLAWHAFSTAIVALPARQHRDAAEARRLLEPLGVTIRQIPLMADLLVDGAARNTGPAGRAMDIASLIGREPFPIDQAELESLLGTKRVLITGAGGSIGSEIAMIAARFAPERLILVERAENALFEIDRRLREAHPSLERTSILHDVVDADGTRAYLDEHRPHVVFHAAAHKHVPLMEDHPAHAVTNNLFGTKSIADAAVAAGAERFVLISSDKAVNPTSVMGATKRLAERYIQGLQRSTPGTRFSMVRFGNVLASACSVLPIWGSQLAEGRPITVTDERMTRYFMTIPEAASLVIQSAAVDHDGRSARVFVLDMGEPVRIVDLAERFCRAHGYEPRRVCSSDGAAAGDIVLTGARPGEKLYEELAYSAELLAPTGRPGINAWAAGDTEPADTTALIADLTSVRASRDRDMVLAMIRRHVPEMKTDSEMSTRPGQQPRPAESPRAGSPSDKHEIAA